MPPNLACEALNASPAGKWSPAQQLDHILCSVGPVHLALDLPKWLLRMAFGKPNRSTRSYEEVVRRYEDKLAAGGPHPVVSCRHRSLCTPWNA